MVKINKVCFAYPVKFKEEMTVEETALPSELFYDIQKNSKITVVVTAGLMVSIDRIVYIDISVNRQGEGADPERIKKDGKYENLRSHFIYDNQGIFLTSMQVEDVLFDDSGIYEIIVTMYDSDDNGNQVGIVLDRYSSYFYALVKADA